MGNRVDRTLFMQKVPQSLKLFFSAPFLSQQSTVSNPRGSTRIAVSICDYVASLHASLHYVFFQTSATRVILTPNPDPNPGGGGVQASADEPGGVFCYEGHC